MQKHKYIPISWLLDQERLIRKQRAMFTTPSFWLNLLCVLFLMGGAGLLLVRGWQKRKIRSI